MARILGYIATSLDGFVATTDNTLEWLSPYGELEFGEHDPALFLARVRTLVMGRGTYDFLEADGSPWPYGGKRVYVVTSRPIFQPKGPLELRRDVDLLIAELRALHDGDVWMVGGGRLQMAFLERAALDELELYIMPELIGGGRPLFPPAGLRASPKLISATVLDRGCVRLKYSFPGPVGTAT
jgi:dihydrofolate reductase